MMFTRRDFLARSSLLAFAPLVPQFLARTARAAEPGKDTVLVILEMTGGNDGLNTVIPHANDLYHKNRPTLRIAAKEVLKIDDEIGLHPSMSELHRMYNDKQLAIVQGVGYPNPDRSHFESMDIWQSADPKRQQKTGWLARSVPLVQDNKGNVPAMHVANEKTLLPLALSGAAGGVISMNKEHPFDLELAGTDDRQKARRKLLDDLAKEPAGDNDAADFVRRRQVQAYASIERLKEILKVDPNNPQQPIYRGRGQDYNADLMTKFQLIATMISKGFGSRIYYVSTDGFDTHSNQGQMHGQLLGGVSSAIATFFEQLKAGDQGKRVLLLTFSEFGRRVKENGSKGTDHGAGSCLFLAGPGVAAGPVGKHPKLDDLDSGDLKHHTDFRQVYATLLDQWLGCDSSAVLGAKFPHLPLLAKKA
jgi:uncharacterized protein (DUF1501 family)